MTNNKQQYIVTAVLLVVVLVAGYFGIKLPNPGVPEPLPYTEVGDAGGVGTRSAIGRAIQFDRNIRMAQDLAVVGDVAVTGAQTVGGALTVTGAITGGTLACTSASWPVNVVITGTTDIDGATTITGTTTLKTDLAMSQTNAAGGSANPIDYTATLGAMNGSDDFTLLDVNITNANHTSTGNTVQAIDIAGITADAEATETAIKVGSGWDYGLDLDGNVLVIGADGGVTLDETADDAVALTFGAGGGIFTVATGNLQVGGGTPGVTLNGQDAYVTGTFEVDGAAQFDGAVAATSTLGVTGLSTLTGGATVAGWTTLTAQTTIVVTDTMTIAPTGTYQALSSTGAVACNTTTCIANGTVNGQLLILRNANASDTITIDGTGANVECKADKVLGAQDTLTLLWNGADWVCLASSDNS